MKDQVFKNKLEKVGKGNDSRDRVYAHQIYLEIHKPKNMEAQEHLS